MIFCPFFLLLTVPAELACPTGTKEATVSPYSGQNPDWKSLRRTVIDGIVMGIGSGSRRSGGRGR